MGSSERYYEKPKGCVKDLCLYLGNWKASINGFSGVNYVRRVDCRKFIAGYVFTFTTLTISWISGLHKCVALSITWTNYVVATKAYTKGFKDLRSSQRPSPILLCGNQSSITLAWNLVYHARMKHIHVKYYFIRYLLNNKYCIIRDVLNNKGIEPFKEHKDENSKNHIFPKRLTQLIHEWMAQICKYIQLNTQIYANGNYTLNACGGLLDYKVKRFECDIYKASSLYT